MYTYITICAIYNVYSYHHGITFLSFNPIELGFLIAVTKCLTRDSLRKKSVFWLTVCEYSWRWWGRHNGRSTRQLLTWHPQSGSRERWTLVLSSQSSLFIWPRMPAQGGKLKWLFPSELTSLDNSQDMPTGQSNLGELSIENSFSADPELCQVGS